MTAPPLWKSAPSRLALAAGMKTPVSKSRRAVSANLNDACSIDKNYKIGPYIRGKSIEKST
jgi:hypothetical protein